MPRSFSTSRYSKRGLMNSGHSSRSFSSVAASVLNPVFVFLPGVSWRSLYNTSCNCVGELKLIGRPTTASNFSLSALARPMRSLLIAVRAATSTPMPSVSIFANTRMSGCSMSTYNDNIPEVSSAVRRGAKSTRHACDCPTDTDASGASSEPPKSS